MIRSLYDWAMRRVSGPGGERWLAGLSFAESSFFPIPPDVLLIPMVLAERARAWRLATVTTVASVSGAGLGYLIGAFFYEAVAEPLITLYGYDAKMASFRDLYARYGIALILVGGLTPIPFKVITISSGLAGLNPLVFMAACVPARAPRFFIVAALLWRFGPPIRAFVEKRLVSVITLVTLAVILGFVALRFL